MVKIPDIHKVIKHLRVGDKVQIPHSQEMYTVAEIRLYPHGYMIGIYDEMPHNLHIDYINPDRVIRIVP